MKVDNTIVMLKRVAITRTMYLEKIALLDRKAKLSDYGSLPEGEYGIYYRVVLEEGVHQTSICDFSGDGLNQNTDDVIAFFLRNKR